MLKKALTLLGLTITLSVSSLATAAVVTYQGMDYTIEWAHMGWAEIDQNSIYGPGGQPWYSNTNPHVADTWANLLGDTYLETASLPEGPLFAGKFHTNNVIMGYFWDSGTQQTAVKYYNYSIEQTYAYVTAVSPSAIPVPAAAWLFGSALTGLLVMRRKIS